MYLHEQHDFTAAWFVLQQAVAEAQLTGLHRSDAGQPYLWNSLVRLSLVQSFVTGRPTTISRLPLVERYGVNLSSKSQTFSEPVSRPLKDLPQYLSSAAFARVLEDATALQARPDEDAFWYFETRVKAWAAWPARSDVERAAEEERRRSAGAEVADASVKTDPDRRNLGTPAPRQGRYAHTILDEPVTVPQRIVYFVLSRLVLLTLRAPFVGSQVANTVGHSVPPPELDGLDDPEDALRRGCLRVSAEGFVGGPPSTVAWFGDGDGTPDETMLGLTFDRAIGVMEGGAVRDVTDESGQRAGAFRRGSQPMERADSMASTAREQDTTTGQLPDDMSLDQPLTSCSIPVVNGGFSVKLSQTVPVPQTDGTDTRYGTLKDAVTDAREIVTALKVLRQHFPAATAGGGLLRTAALLSTVSAAYTSRAQADHADV